VPAADPVPAWTCDDVVAWLRAHASQDNVTGMARYGIETGAALGISNAQLRPLSRHIRCNHERALALWQTGLREARLVACFTDEPGKVTAQQAWQWADDFNSWEVVDHAADLFVEAGLHDDLVAPFVGDKREFVRRAGFAMMAWGAVHLKKQPDSLMESWLPLIERHSTDQRNFVKKAVNWALRQIGKRSPSLHQPVLALARTLAQSEDRTARWIGRDAVRELESEKTLQRLAKRNGGNQ
jgi:3-methyladenine DNA glycosylase AlkD